MRKIDRTGEEKNNTFGSTIRIINYRNNKDIDVFFPEYNYTKEHVRYEKFKKGNVSCPYERRYFNVGYIGKGEYKVSKNGKCTKCYNTWRSMLRRCYDSEYQAREPAYIGCEVSEYWLNFQTFAGWYYDNIYQIEDEIIALDKDILCKGNKIYSPDVCVFVPQTINNLFTKRDNYRGNYPVGVYYKKKNKKYIAQCNVNEKQKCLGYYNTPEEAFEVYKNFKEKYIKEVAEEYKNMIPTKLYNAMINYKVEIND